MGIRCFLGVIYYFRRDDFGFIEADAEKKCFVFELLYRYNDFRSCRLIREQ